MKTQSAKAKGRRLQQQIVRDILACYPEQLTDDDVRSTSMGASGEDVLLSAHARRLFPYSIEAKNQERLNVWEAIRQCEGNCATDAHPLIVIHRNQSKVYALVEWSHFLALQKPRPSDGDGALIERARALRQQLDEFLSAGE